MKIEIRCKFANFEIFEGLICNFWNFIGIILKILENLRTKCKILKIIRMKKF